MGAGASANVPQEAQIALSSLFLEKPADGSDIKVVAFLNLFFINRCN